MSDDYGAITSAALALPEKERADVAVRLLDSLRRDEGLEDQESVESAWREEIRRRADRIDRDGSPGKPWSKVKARLLARDQPRD